MTHHRTTGTCPTCKRKGVTLMSKQPDAQCSVCTRVAGVAAKILANQPITPTDEATIRRVLSHVASGQDGSIETTVAKRKGWVELFNRSSVPWQPEWPMLVSAWKCSDGTLHPDETAAMRIELTLTRNRRKAA